MQAKTFVPTEPFRPARFLRSPHAQTIFGSLLRKAPLPPLKRERWTTPDEDFVDVDIVDAPADAPTVFVLHGMEGSSRSGYVAEILIRAAAKGWGVFAFNFRSCSGEPNRLARSYHFGDFEDPAWALAKIAARRKGTLFGVGFSLGGNVLLKLLAEQGDRCALDRAVAVSVPFDLGVCTRALDDRRSLWAFAYRSHFLRSLVPKTLEKARLFPGTIDPARVRAVRGVRDFDETVTSRLHGFANAAEYYERTSSVSVLDKIARPTLLINSTDDPFCPIAIPKSARDNPNISLLETAHGGHVGFIGGSTLRPRFWAEEQAVAFLASR
jgi:predicted alpha/beta-fold hydrolase